MNINGAVNIKTMEMVTDFTKRGNKESSLQLFLKIIKRHPKATIRHVPYETQTLEDVDGRG
jgi:hypothetical protein